MLTIGSDKLYLYHRKILEVYEPLITAFYNALFQNFVTVTPFRICIWDAYSGCLLRAHESSKIYGSSSTDVMTHEITSCTIDCTGKRLFVGDESGSIKVVNYMNGAVLKSLDPHIGSVTCIGYTPLDKCVLSSGTDGKFQISDDVDVDGYLDEKNGRQVRSVLMRSIEIDATVNTNGGGGASKVDADASGGGGRDRRASRIFGPMGARKSSSVVSLSSIQSAIRRSSVMSIGGGGAGVGGVVGGASVGGNNQSSSNQAVVVAGAEEAASLDEMIERRVRSPSMSSGQRRVSVLKNNVLGNEEAGSFAEFSVFAFSTHLNLIATGATVGSGEHHFNLWDYETCSLLGTCVHPSTNIAERFDVIALEFMNPKPFLLGSFRGGLMHIWKVPDAICMLTLYPSFTDLDSWMDDSDLMPRNRAVAADTTSFCVVNMSRNSSSDRASSRAPAEEGEEVSGDSPQMVFASDEKGFVFAWLLTKQLMASNNSTASRRRTTFNPHRMVKVAVWGDELMHYNRIALRSQSSRAVKVRTPSFFWKAHEESISKISYVDHPASLVTASQDYLAKIWDLKGNLLGKLNFNEPTAMKKMWKFKPQVAKAIQNKQKDEDFHEFLTSRTAAGAGGGATTHLLGDPQASESLATDGGEAPGRPPTLHRHQSQEDFLNREFHGLEKKVVGSTSGSGGGPRKVKKIERVTSWNSDSVSVVQQSEEQRGQIERIESEGGIMSTGGDKHWDGMMDSLHVFETALSRHTKIRVDLKEDNYQLKKKKVLFDHRPKNGKHWKIAPVLEQPSRTLVRKPMDRPRTSSSRLGGRRRGAGGNVLQRRPGTSQSLLNSARNFERTGSSRARPRSSVRVEGGDVDDGKNTVSVVVKLKHMGYN